MDGYTMWIWVCDWLIAVCTGGMMHDDFPEYPWHECWEWGEHPTSAVSGALHRLSL